MFSYIRGKITDKEAGRITVENNGIGYEIFVSSNTLAYFNRGDEALIYTYFQVKQDGAALLGFQNKEEKNMFSRLITVNGIGPKNALAILSGITPCDLAFAVAKNDPALLAKVKGIGKKTAARIVLELKEKIVLEDGEVAGGAGSDGNGNLGGGTDDAVVALQALGFARADALKAVGKAAALVSGTENIIRAALKLMN
ncbi:MAG: Holliday junction branch migration protein RuvA [Clostridiales bacterium]|jgi:Holliday junction DNA helicase RuvA|nr:Holliday junction branch migration protein RuvA [Clostridiales bacterium]